MTDLSSLRSSLLAAAQTAVPGEKLPTVRQLMKDFALSQLNVERVLDGLKQEGLIAAHVGRGTFFTGNNTGQAPAPRSPAIRTGRSVMLLRRSQQNARARNVLDRLQEKIADAGDVTLDVGYSNAAHARQVLQTLPRFDACIIQNSFDAMPIEMISAIRRKTDTVVVDGAWLVGTDVDAVGFEWGEPIAAAIHRLLAAGHDHITLVTTDRFFLANELGLHRYRAMRQQEEFAGLLQPEICLSSLPSADFEQTVVEAIMATLEGTAPKHPAIIVWGVENGARLRSLLGEAGLSVPDQLSVVLLGRTDVAAEAADFFDIVGYSAAEQAEGVFERLLERWRNPTAPYGLRLMQMRMREGQSIGGPHGH
ncbi:substrate-binding domain-containing protein [Devosia aurantiaca]|uniref:GntR family transcriptional regulator n=1 Tax=Devosia aurantiaca TaxID=2714858 RepID=A0A6M1SLT4_9HYPH|nr:substrate-binding domain-containing protein [Devosia aurantiaca]NGP16492.1 GntR family transcriptional regulator [Devosia aurantiaca]